MSIEKRDANDQPASPSPDPVSDTTQGAPPTAVENGENGHVALAASAQDDSLRGLMTVNFIEYASYVIKERAIPDIDDGLKPVQRRILHSLYELDDGRFHKVANIIGHTMRYHPHGDQSIGNALVVLANKEYFIDRQGNFGNIFTGDAASASRYIECRLTPLAREVLFNPEITETVDSYDGRNREPVSLPAKVPALLMLGSDGIAVGMTTRVLPHNFVELLEAQISILRGQDFALYPDFLTGGLMDVQDYDDGRGRIKVRAKIETPDDKTLIIREIPASTTTESLMGSVEDAVRKGKLKIASIHDYTAGAPEIEIKLPRGVHARETIKLLYAYTDCQVSISSNMIVIKDNRPVEMTVSAVLRHNTEKLLDDLRRELELQLGKLQERFHEKTLAQIFIENRIYKRIEECETYARVLAEVRKGLAKFRHLLRRDITDEDIEKLLQLQIRRISLFDINKNRQEIDDILKGIEETQDNLDHLKAYAVRYLKALLKKYGKQYPRRTQIEDLEAIDVKKVALQNIRVGHDRGGHFLGSDVRNSNKNEPPFVCSEFDRLVLMQTNGKYKVIPIPDKLYVGPVKYVFKADRLQVYCMVYRQKKGRKTYAKRFRIDRYIMDREYAAAPPGCTIENIYTNYGVVLRCELVPRKRQREASIDVDFETVPIRSAGARGFKVTDHPVASFTQVRRGTPTPPTSGEEPGEDPEQEEQGPDDAPAPADDSARDAALAAEETGPVDEPAAAVDGDHTPDAGGEPESPPSAEDESPGDVSPPAGQDGPPKRRSRAKKAAVAKGEKAPKKTADAASAAGPAEGDAPAAPSPPTPPAAARAKKQPRQTRARPAKPETGAASDPADRRELAREWERRTAEATRVPEGTDRDRTRPSPSGAKEPETENDDAKRLRGGKQKKGKEPTARAGKTADEGPTARPSSGKAKEAAGRDPPAAEPSAPASPRSGGPKSTKRSSPAKPRATRAKGMRRRIDEETPFFLE